MMPRRRATKACQTDYFFLSEQQVEIIVNQRVGQLEDELKKTQANQHKSNNQCESEIKEIMAPTLNGLKESMEELEEQINHLKTSSDKIENDLDSLNNLQQSTEVLVEQLDGRLDSIEEETEQKIKDLNNRLEDNDNQHEMTSKVDDVEQQSKLRNLRFFGMDEQEGEDPARKVIEFVQKHMNIQIKPSEIEANRIGPTDTMNTKPRDILVKFDSGFLRNAIYKRKVILREQNQQIFINEDLTVKRSHLFFEARKMRKQQKLFGVWTQAGNILVKVNSTSSPIAVSNIEEIKRIINVSPSTESDTDIETTSFEDALP